MSAVDALVEDIGIIRKSLEALHKEVAVLSKRGQEQGKHLTRVELDEVLAKVKQETNFSIRYDLLADKIQPHLATPAKVDAVLVSGLQRVEQVISRIPSSVPIEGEVWGFTNWRVGALSVGTTLVLLLLLLWFPGVFSRVPKEQFEQVQTRARLEGERADRLVVIGKQAISISKFYNNQIRNYIKKNPKARANFPEYVTPLKLPQE